MSEPIPESIPTSQDPRSKRPTKRRALTPTSNQAASLSALFAKPTRDIALPSSSSITTNKQHSLPPPPEIVANVQGSSAGAGSGEFHVYKASRRREYERVKMMEETVEREEQDSAFEKKRDELRRRDEERTEKRRKKRERGKKRGMMVKEMKKKEGMEEEDEVREDEMVGKEGRDEEHVFSGPENKRVESVGVMICDDD